MPVPPRAVADADTDPTPEQIEAWANDVEAPSASLTKEETPAEGDEETPAPQEGESHKDEPTEEGKEEPKKKSKYTEKVEQRKQRDESWFNNQHKQLRLREKRLEELEAKLAQRERELEQKPEDWEAFAKQLEQYGDYEKAELARQQAQQAQRAQADRQNQDNYQKWFQSEWSKAEQEISQGDPDFFKEGTYVADGLKDLFTNPANQELADQYRQHPMGIWAAYHAIRLKQAQEIIPQLVALVQKQQDELEQYQKGNAPLSGKPKANLGPKPFKDMNDEELEKSIIAELSKQ